MLRDDFVGHPLRKSLRDGSGRREQRARAPRRSATPGESPHNLGPADGCRARSAAPRARPLRRGASCPATRHCTPSGSSSTWARSTRACTACFTCGSRSRARSSRAPSSRHGYLHRCIEKLCENAQLPGVHRAARPLRLRLGLPHRTRLPARRSRSSPASSRRPKRSTSACSVSELVRITSHHTWFTAVGFDTGALTPFFAAFIDREMIVDFFETVTGARMMFNYFRPGGVKDDLQPAADKAHDRDILEERRPPIDDCESLLTNNEIFRNRVARHRIHLAEPHRGLRRDRSDVPCLRPGLRPSPRRALLPPTPTSPVNVPLGEAGDTFDRYTVRIAEMRESGPTRARRRSTACPKGRLRRTRTCRASSSRPRAPPTARSRARAASSACLLVSDGTANPWRLKVRSPAPSRTCTSRRRCSTGSAMGDVVAVIGSVDVVMGEIDR